MNMGNINHKIIIAKFMSAMGLNIVIEDDNQETYHYFRGDGLSPKRIVTYVVKVINNKGELVYAIRVFWEVINGGLKIYNISSHSSKANPFAYLGLGHRLVNEYLAEKTRELAEEWIKKYPEPTTS